MNNRSELPVYGILPPEVQCSKNTKQQKGTCYYVIHIVLLASSHSIRIDVAFILSLPLVRIGELSLSHLVFINLTRIVVLKSLIRCPYPRCVGFILASVCPSNPSTKCHRYAMRCPPAHYAAKNASLLNATFHHPIVV